MKKLMIALALMAGPVAAVDSGSVQDAVKVICGETVNNDFMPRLKAVHGLGKDINAADFDKLLSFLKRKEGFDGLAPQEVHALKNDILSALRASHQQDGLLADELTAMYKDKSNDEVWRDYCIQHLGDMFQYVRPEKQGELAQMFFDATEKERDSSIAGTALIALLNNEGKSLKGGGQPGKNIITREIVSSQALAVLNDNSACELAKITALQICAKTGEGRVLEHAKKILKTQESVPLKVSAIGALGLAGGPDEIPLLEKLSSSSVSRLRTASEAALLRLRGKKPE
jgi:hypothetical protein